MKTDDKLLDTKEAAILTGLSVHTLIKYRKEGIGPPYFKVNNFLVRYKHDEVVAWMEKQHILPINGDADGE